MASGFLSFGSSSMSLLLWTSLYMFLLFYIFKYGKQLIFWALKARRVINALSVFPGPPRHWLYGHVHLIPDFGEKGLAFFHDCTRKYPKLYTLWIGPARPSLTVCHPDTCKVVLKSTLPKPVSGMGGYTFLTPWLGDGLLLSSGKKWFRNRRLLTPAFHFDVLKPYMKINNAAADTLVEKLSEANTNLKSVDVFNPVSLCTLDVMLQCAFSSDMDIQSAGEKHPYVHSVISIAQLMMVRLLNPLLYPTTIYNLTSSGKTFNKHLKLVHEVATDVISKRKKTLENNPDSLEKRHRDFLDILILARDTDGKGLTDREIRDEVDTFLFEGHDTTASAISWTLYSLAQHPEHQQKCYEEISALLADRNEQNFEWDDFGRLPYLTMCIKEAMRLHSPVPVIGREVDTEFEIEGVTLPVGTLIDVNIYQMHNNKAVWGEDCGIYKPERFASGDAPDTFAFVPFSAGPRNCIGQTFAMHEIKVIVAKIINRYSMKVDPLIPALHLSELVMRSEKGLYIYFNTRNQKDD